MWLGIKFWLAKILVDVGIVVAIPALFGLLFVAILAAVYVSDCYRRAVKWIRSL